MLVLEIFDALSVSINLESGWTGAIVLWLLILLNISEFWARLFKASLA